MSFCLLTGGQHAQKESDRLGLGLRFMTLAPRIMPDSDLGRHAVAGYSRYLRMSEADFVRSMGSAPSPSDVARAAIELATTAEQHKGKLFVVSGKGLEVVALLKEDAIYTMPPVAQWYSGRDAIRAFFAWAWKFYSGCRLIPTSANGQPAFG